jgi:hypothetical protein
VISITYPVFCKRNNSKNQSKSNQRLFKLVALIINGELCDKEEQKTHPERNSLYESFPQNDSYWSRGPETAFRMCDLPIPFLQPSTLHYRIPEMSQQRARLSISVRLFTH